MNESRNQKTVPISGRIGEKDYEYLMSHGEAGQVTASEKLRHACSFYRLYHERTADREESITEIHRLIQNGMSEVRESERKEGMYSDLLHRMADSLPEMVGILANPELKDKQGGRRESLIQVEEELFNRLLLLLEQLLRLGVTRETPTYNRQLTRGRFDTVRELISLSSQISSLPNNPE